MSDHLTGFAMGGGFTYLVTKLVDQHAGAGAKYMGIFAGLAANCVASASMAKNKPMHNGMLLGGFVAAGYQAVRAIPPEI